MVLNQVLGLVTWIDSHSWYSVWWGKCQPDVCGMKLEAGRSLLRVALRALMLSAARPRAS